jgi:hypothetical protein
MAAGHQIPQPPPHLQLVAAQQHLQCRQGQAQQHSLQACISPHRLKVAQHTQQQALQGGGWQGGVTTCRTAVDNGPWQCLNA